MRPFVIFVSDRVALRGQAPTTVSIQIVQNIQTKNVLEFSNSSGQVSTARTVVAK
jgi:hypothetical protein